MRIDIRIAAYTFRLTEKDDKPFFYWPQPYFLPFLTNDIASDPQITIEVTRKLPELPRQSLIFDAGQGLWKLWASDPGYLLETYHTKTHKPYTRSIVSRDFSEVRLWVIEKRKKGVTRGGWAPTTIINPVVEICLLTRLAREGGLLLHASGVSTKQGGFVFTGEPESGKSTLADFFAAQGRLVLNDERIIIRKIDGKFSAWGTPWPGTSHIANNEKAPLSGIFFIRHGKESHTRTPLPPRESSILLLQQCFLPHWDREGMERTVQFCAKIAEQIPCFELAFLKRHDIVEFLEEGVDARAFAAV